MADQQRFSQQAPRRWYTQSGDECAASVVNIGKTLENNDAIRRTTYQFCLSLYEGRPVNIDSDEYLEQIQPDMAADRGPTYNLIRSGCDTVQADIAGRQKPMPSFLTSGGDWKMRRRATKMDKFCEGQFNQSQGIYPDIWQLMNTVFHDSAKMGTGIAKVWPDIENKKVEVERVFPWEVFVDPREAKYSRPKSLFQVATMDRDMVLAIYGDTDEKKAMIERASPAPNNDGLRVVDSIKVWEAWRLPLNKKIPGKHVIAIDGCLLAEEDWEEPDFPFLILHWNRNTVGFWGTGIAQEGAAQQALVDDVAERLAQRIAICSTLRTYVNPKVIDVKKMVEGGDSELVIEVDDMAQMPQTPPPQPASQAEFQWLAENIQRFYEMLGISTMSANAQKPPGVDAAVAMQTLNDIATTRFLPKARAYEQSFATMGKLMIRAAARIAEKAGGYLVRWPGKNFLKEMDFADIKIDEELYEIRVASVSQFSRDPAAILELSQELFSQGLINKETFFELIKLPDLENALSLEGAEREYLEELFERYLDSTDDQELEDNGGFETPEPFILNRSAAAWLAVQTYWKAKQEKAPEYCLDLLRRFIVELQPNPSEAPPDAVQAAPGGGPMAAPNMAPGQQGPVPSAPQMQAA